MNIKITHNNSTQQYIIPKNYRDIQSIINDLVILFQISDIFDTSENYILRENETETLVTHYSTLVRMLLDGENSFILSSSPKKLAVDLFKDICSEDASVVTKGLVLLQKSFKEVEFLDSFLGQPHSLKQLIKIICSSEGNLLGYALVALQNLMEHDHGWEALEANFIGSLVNIIVSQNMANICRPATAIIIKLINANPTSGTRIQNYGFDVVHKEISSQSSFFPTIVERLNSSNYMLQLNSLNLINALFKQAGDKHRADLLYLLDSLHIRRIAMKMMQSNPSEETGAQLLEFQMLLIREFHRKMKVPVFIHNSHPKEEALLNNIWAASRLAPMGNQKWRILGFATETPKKEFTRVGLLGLETINNFIEKHEDYFVTLLTDQEARTQSEKRVPFARVAIEACEILCDYWEISTGISTCTTFDPLLLAYDSVYIIVLQSMYRVWVELNITIGEGGLAKVSQLVRSQVYYSMSKIITSSANSLSSFEFYMLEIPVSTIIERHVCEIDADGDFATKKCVRSLREKIYRQSYEFMKQQRISCLLKGTWFPLFTNTAKRNGIRRNNHTIGITCSYRFYKLNPNLKVLHYGDFTDIGKSRPLLEELNERVDLSLVTDVILIPPPTVKNQKQPEIGQYQFHLSTSTRDEQQNQQQFLHQSFVQTSSPSLNNPSSSILHSFSLNDETAYVEWSDGFNMLFGKSITHKETATLINELTDISVKLALLDLTAEEVLYKDTKIGNHEIPPLPPNFEFVYDIPRDFDLSEADINAFEGSDDESEEEILDYDDDDEI